MMIIVEHPVECLAGEIEVLGSKPAPVRLRAQVPYALTRAQSRTAVMGSRRLTT
jgi:hypothetical protein